VGLGVVFVGFGMWFVGALGRDLAGGYGVEVIYTIEAWAMVGLVMLMLVGFAILFISDARWGKLPVRYLVFCVVCAVLFVIVREWGVVFAVGKWSVYAYDRIWGYLGAVLVLPVFYYLLYKASGEKWVGSGDWLVALPIALVLGDFWLAFFVLFLANLLGSVVMVPMMVGKKKKMRKVRIPFGPFLIVGFVIVFLAQDWLRALI